MPSAYTLPVMPTPPDTFKAPVVLLVEVVASVIINTPVMVSPDFSTVLYALVLAVFAWLKAAFA